MPLLCPFSHRLGTKPRFVAPHQAVLETMPHPVARNDASRSPRLRRRSTARLSHLSPTRHGRLSPHALFPRVFASSRFDPNRSDP